MSSFPTPEQTDAAAKSLADGLLVAFPTETVYGLGADAENPEAVAKIYAAKGRPSKHPVIVHLSPEADLKHWVNDVPELALRLITAFWPGPLTLILKRAAHIPDAVSGGQDSIGVRCPSHPVAQALLRSFKGGQGGIAAPSANKFGHVSPTTAQHVRDEFLSEIVAGGLIASVLDGGASEVGIESTIVDMTRLATHGPVLLRPGHITAEQLAAVLGVAPAAPDLAAPRASGTLEAHYAPLTPVVLVGARELENLLKNLNNAGKTVAVLSRQMQAQHAALAWRQLPADAQGFAHDVYAGLRDLDRVQAQLIVVEAPPNNADWKAVNDRLRRAAFDSHDVLRKLLA